MSPSLSGVPAHIEDARERLFGEEDFAAVASLALDAASFVARDIQGERLLSVLKSDRQTHELVDIESYLPAPVRRRGQAIANTVESFMALVARDGNPDRTTIWVHPTSGEITAVLNDHGTVDAADTEDDPQWGDHRIVLRLVHTPEWALWSSYDNRLVGQVEFAEHVERGLRQIAEPAGADLLEMVQTFTAHQTAAFRSATRLDNGETQFRYDETIDETVGGGQVSLPREFTLVLEPFYGEAPRQLVARLRYRLREGKLTLGYYLDEPDRVIRAVLDDIQDRLAEQFQGQVFKGTPRT